MSIQPSNRYPPTGDEFDDAPTSTLRSPPFEGPLPTEVRPSVEVVALGTGVVPVTDLAALPVLLTVAEMAGLLRTTKRAIYARAGRGLLPGIFRPHQRHLLFRRDEVLPWLDNRYE